MEKLKLVASSKLAMDQLSCKFYPYGIIDTLTAESLALLDACSIINQLKIKHITL